MSSSPTAEAVQKVRRAVPDRRERRKVGLRAIGIRGIATEHALGRA